MTARLRGIAYPKIWYLLAMRLSYNWPQAWALGSVFFERFTGGNRKNGQLTAGFGSRHLCATLRHVLGIASYSPNGVLEANVWMHR
jgi:hypothetical protein